MPAQKSICWITFENIVHVFEPQFPQKQNAYNEKPVLKDNWENNVRLSGFSRLFLEMGQIVNILGLVGHMESLLHILSLLFFFTTLWKFKK